MKNIKRLLTSSILFVLMLTVMPIKPIYASVVVPKNKYDFSEANVILSNIDKNGNKVEMFNDKVEVTYLKNDRMIIKDYGHVYDTLYNVNAQPQIARVLLAKFFIGTAGTCSTVQNVTDVDACRIVLKYLGTNRRSNVKYELTGRYISGKIPGCEPSHFGASNSGYWEYHVVRV